jgi:uncharacterized protein
VSPRRKQALFTLAVVFLSAVLILGGCSLITSANAAQAPVAEGTPVRTVSVVGQGSVSARPDMATINLGVETYAATVAEASKQNAGQMDAVLAKLKELGVAEKDIQTSNYSISFDQGNTSIRGTETAAASQYRVSNTVLVKVRDLAKVGTVLDGVTGVGANQVWGISFTVNDEAPLEAQARAKAADDARQRAEDLARLHKVQVGDVLTIAETSVSTPVYRALDMAASAKGAGTSINPGEVEYTYQVQVTYLLK